MTVGGGEQDSVFSIAGGQPGTVGGDLLWAGAEAGEWRWWHGCDGLQFWLQLDTNLRESGKRPLLGPLLVNSDY